METKKLKNSISNRKNRKSSMNKGDIHLTNNLMGVREKTEEEVMDLMPISLIIKSNRISKTISLLKKSSDKSLRSLVVKKKNLHFSIQRRMTQKKLKVKSTEQLLIQLRKKSKFTLLEQSTRRKLTNNMKRGTTTLNSNPHHTTSIINPNMITNNSHHPTNKEEKVVETEVSVEEATGMAITTEEETQLDIIKKSSIANHNQQKLINNINNKKTIIIAQGHSNLEVEEAEAEEAVEEVREIITKKVAIIIQTTITILIARVS